MKRKRDETINRDVHFFYLGGSLVELKLAILGKLIRALPRSEKREKGKKYVDDDEDVSAYVRVGSLHSLP